MKTLTRTIVLAVSLIFAGAAWAGHHGHDRKDRRDMPDLGGLPAIGYLTSAFRRLDLDEDQKAAVRDKLGAMREQIHPLLRQVHEGRRELHELITAAEFDEKAVSALATDQGNLTTEITMLVAGAASAMLAQLTDEQRSELQDLREKHRARREARKEKRRAPGVAPAPEDET